MTTFAFGSPELYAWLDGNSDVAFLPVEIVNSPEVIAANDNMISVNGALAIDIHGQVVADTINGGQFSGIGGAEDFVAGAGLELSDRSLICLPSTFEKDGKLQSRIVPWFGPGAVITTPRHQVDVIVTEYGAAELEGRPFASAAKRSPRSPIRSSATSCWPRRHGHRMVARQSPDDQLIISA